MQLFQARAQCIPGISAIINCSEKKRREQHYKVKTEAPKVEDYCFESQKLLKNIKIVIQQLLLKGLEQGN